MARGRRVAPTGRLEPARGRDCEKPRGDLRCEEIHERGRAILMAAAAGRAIARNSEAANRAMISRAKIDSEGNGRETRERTRGNAQPGSLVYDLPRALSILSR